MQIAVDIIKFILLVVVTFFTCQIITNNRKRLSIIGTFLICFSTAVVRYINSGLLEGIIFGEIFIICLYNILIDKKYKYLWNLGIPISVIGYMLLSNTSFQIALAFSIVAIALWMILKNHNLKNKIVPLVIEILFAIVISALFYNYNPINTLENKSIITYLMNYLYSPIAPFNRSLSSDERTCISTMISVFPVTLFISIVYIFKYEDKHTEFFMPTIIISLIELILLGVGKLSFLVPSYILVISLNILQIYIMIYIFANIEEKLFGLTKSAYIALLLGLLVFLVSFPSGVNTTVVLEITYMIFVLEAYIVLNYSDRRFWRLASWVFPFIALFESIGCLIVNFM